MSPTDKSNYYRRFRAAALRFEVIGGILLAVGIAANFLFHTSLLAVSLIFAGPGALLLILGGSSLQPHNLVKSFAQQCVREPGREMAQGLLDALCSTSKIRLMAGSIQLVQSAIAVYADTPDADLALVQRLRDEAENRLVQKVF